MVASVRDGSVRVAEVPAPLVRPKHVLIANRASVISAGTEKMTLELARKSLLGKAVERPDQLRRVLEALKSEGLFATLDKVRSRLDEPLTLGYASAGRVLACGPGVQGFRPGQRVASNGPHAGVVCVPASLCALVPDPVPTEQAALGVIGAIALHGMRLSRLELGERAFVIGLGVVGQITVALLRAAGVRVLGTDPQEARCALALRMGAERAGPSLSAEDVVAWTGGVGADAVVIAAATESNAPVQLAAEAVRSKGRIVAVGAVGLDVPRRAMYFKEAELIVSRSYGPGRYDPSYEEHGQDYPLPYVRWTEQRNLQAVLDLMAAGQLDVAPLISHRFPIEDAEAAFELVSEGAEPHMGILLEYPEAEEAAWTPLRTSPVRAATGDVGVGILGAGNFARSVLLPAIRQLKTFRPEIVCSAGGLSAAQAAEKLGFAEATADEARVLHHPGVQVVFIATRHDLHAGQVARALRAGKHVFVEKPLALTPEELSAIDDSLREPAAQGSILMVGFNRRFSPAAVAAKSFFAGVTEPLTVAVRMNAGSLPPEHWAQNEDVGGGRIIGEACHALDLATFLVGSPPVRVFAESVGASGPSRVTDDQAFITLRHANGSVSSIAYLAGGDRTFGKERVEILGGGRLAVIDDFAELVTSAGGRRRRRAGWRRDKGHRAEVAAFADAVIGRGPAPIPWGEIRAVTLASILAVRSLREGVPFEVG